MAIDEHIAMLKKGVEAWNAWRDENPDIRPDLNGANLRGVKFNGANLSYADLFEANLSKANLRGANLSKANLFDANLSKANLNGAQLNGASLVGANLSNADLVGANLSRADLAGANLSGAFLRGALLVAAFLIATNLSKANLNGASLNGANLSNANLNGATLSGASLYSAAFLDTDLTGADLTGCYVYGVSAWGLKLDGATQQLDLVITPKNEPEITVDNIEVAQFIYLLLHNPKIRDVIDTIGRKAVLILGRFTPERKAVLYALREELRKHDYVPILFDFDKPASQDLTATVSTLAHLARFIIADLTDPSLHSTRAGDGSPHYAHSRSADPSVWQ